MFRLTYLVLQPRQGWTFAEQLFTAHEKRTAVEVAREKLANSLCKSVNLLDLTAGKAEVEVVTVLPVDPWIYKGRFYPVQIGQFVTKVPAFERIDLAKLPRPSKALCHTRHSVKKPKIAVKAEDIDLTAKPRRTSKRERQFGLVRV